MLASGSLYVARRLPRLLRVHPRWLVTVPTVAAVEGSAPGRARVRVDGMVCAACAVRTGAAFGRVPGVRAVRVDLDAGVAELRWDGGAAPRAAELQRALDRVVVAKPARRLLARAAARLTRRWKGERSCSAG